MLLVDTNVILDLLEDDPRWYEWSAGQLAHQSQAHELLINPVIYAELACFHETPQQLDSRIVDLELRFQEMPKIGLFFAGMAHRHYRHLGGPRESILADFLIGAHAVALGCGIITRDPRRYRTHFPRVPLITPS